MTGVYDTCAECGAAIAHQKGRGKARKYCSCSCQTQAAERRASEKVFSVCVVDGCSKPAVRVGHQMCEHHYMRQRRNGTTDYIGHKIPGDLEHSGGYIMQAAPGHPRSLGSHRAYQHRVVFTDEYGEGPFNCHWCGKTVTWADMHVDHLDSDKQNNDVGNLVASCPICNQQRGHERLMMTLRAKTGVTIDGVTKTLNEWAKHYGIARQSIILRIRAGWTAERAITEPRGIFGPKCHNVKTAEEAKRRCQA